VVKEGYEGRFTKEGGRIILQGNYFFGGFLLDCTEESWSSVVGKG
jgi:hypothetical protein